MVTSFAGLLALVGLERLFELALSARNAAWSRAQGGYEVGYGHWGAMVALHLGFLLAPLAEVVCLHRPWRPEVGYPMLGLVVAAQLLRYWAVTTLGRHWNVRIFVVPGARAVTGGPYRWLRHPNYVAVILEGVALPLVHGAYLSALAFTGLNLWLLRHRIAAEQAALFAATRNYGDVGRRGAR